MRKRNKKFNGRYSKVTIAAGMSMLLSVSIPGRVFLFPGIREWQYSFPEFPGTREWRILWGTDDREKIY